MCNSNSIPQTETERKLAALRAGCDKYGFDYNHVVSLIPQVRLGQPSYAYRRGKRIEKYYPTVDGHTVYVDPTSKNHGDLTASQSNGYGRYRATLPKSDHSLAAFVAYVCPELKDALANL